MVTEKADHRPTMLATCSGRYISVLFCPNFIKLIPSPETVESLFIAWRLTGHVKYRQYAWNIFSAIEKHCRLEEGGYATVFDVDTVPVSLDDKQETFFLVSLPNWRDFSLFIEPT